VSSQDLAAPAELSRLLGSGYGLILSTRGGHRPAGHRRHRPGAHPLAARTGTRRRAVPLRTAAVGSQHWTGLRATVIRAGDEDAARMIAAGDPFVRAGPRTFTARRWRLNESSAGIRLSLGTPSPTRGSSRRHVTPGRQRCTESA